MVDPKLIVLIVQVHTVLSAKDIQQSCQHLRFSGSSMMHMLRTAVNQAATGLSALE
jgi:hypothetical protein